MEREYFKELSRRLREEGTETSLADKQKLEVLLHGQPVLYVSTTSDVFLLPAGSKSEEASELYHRVAAVADEVYEYVKVLQGAPLLHVSRLNEDFRLLADFGGAVLAGRERENSRGYQFVTWIWNYNRRKLSGSQTGFRCPVRPNFQGAALLTGAAGRTISGHGLSA